MTTKSKTSIIIIPIMSFLSFIKKKILANEGNILISIIMSFISLAAVTIILIVVPPFSFLIILKIFSEEGMNWQYYFEIIGVVSIIVNIIFALNIKKAKFMREVFINAIPSPLISIPIGIIIIVGLTIYKPLMFLFVLFVLYFALIKQNEDEDEE
ncbi:MAG: hypothetical protein KAR07_04070 [Spirochaetes bacterium]|nr:hypothetical protein [Spirochaetota bacterium]